MPNKISLGGAAAERSETTEAAIEGAITRRSSLRSNGALFGAGDQTGGHAISRAPAAHFSPLQNETVRGAEGTQPNFVPRGPTTAFGEFEPLGSFASNDRFGATATSRGARYGRAATVSPRTSALLQCLRYCVRETKRLKRPLQGCRAGQCRNGAQPGHYLLVLSAWREGKGGWY